MISRKRKIIRFRNRALIIITIIALAVALLSIGILVFNNNKSNENNEDVTTTNPTVISSSETPSTKSDDFSLSSLTHVNSSESDGNVDVLDIIGSDYKIFYPKTTSDTINTQIKKDTDYFKSLFKDIPSKYKFADFEISTSNKNLLSVVYTINGYSKNGDLEISDYFTRVFKLNQSKELQRSDIFKDDFYEYASKKTREHFSKNDNTNQHIKKDSYLNATSADGTNFDRFSFDNAGCTLYFDGKTLFNINNQLYSISLKYSDIKKYMKVDEKGNNIPDKNAVKVPQYIPKNVNIDPCKPMIALTFDDGPSSATTPTLLDILEKYNSRATFFVSGTNAKYNTDILKRQVALGCQIGNHTMYHSNLTNQSKKEMHKDIEAVNKIVKDATGYDITLIRPPYGAIDKDVKKAFPNNAFILWSVDTLDWSKRNVDNNVKEVLNSAYDGAVILMHDIHKETVDAAKQFVPKLIDKGYQLVTVDELFYYKGIDFEGGCVYGDAS